jgi:8-oxo-dGTP pyrophosphatase MutT (NUDIX family)
VAGVAHPVELKFRQCLLGTPATGNGFMALLWRGCHDVGAGAARAWCDALAGGDAAARHLPEHLVAAMARTRALQPASAGGPRYDHDYLIALGAVLVADVVRILPEVTFAKAGSEKAANKFTALYQAARWARLPGVAPLPPLPPAACETTISHHVQLAGTVLRSAAGSHRFARALRPRPGGMQPPDALCRLLRPDSSAHDEGSSGAAGEDNGVYMLVALQAYRDEWVIDIGGGKRHPGETAAVCAQREALEETGVSSATLRMHPLGEVVDQGKHGGACSVLHFVQAADLVNLPATAAAS